MNRWNLIHILPPFVCLGVALNLLNKLEPVYKGTVFVGEYYPLLFIIASIFVLAIASFPPLFVKELPGNTLIFFAVYPLWAFSVLSINYFSNAYTAAWAAWTIFVIATIVQWILGFNADE